MCRTKAQGGRRCPTSGGLGIGALKEAVNPKQKPTLEAIPFASTEVGAVDNPALPYFNQLKNSDPDAWFEMPWKTRKTIIEQSLLEIFSFTGTSATFYGWSRSAKTLGRAKVERNRRTGEITSAVELSELNAKLSEGYAGMRHVN